MSVDCPPRAPRAARQRGQAMLLTVLLLGVGVSAVVYNFVTPAKQSVERDRTTAAALAEAKAALIGRAASDPDQPGILPCPDNDNDGTADSPCGVAGAVAIGRLPWKTLGLPDLRDGAGECLWYAVSGNFKKSGVSGPATVNPESPGDLLVDDTNGSAVLAAPNGAVAIVFAPGEVLPGQDRAPVGTTTCGGNVTASNYLDAYTVGVINFNNATGAGGANRFLHSSPVPVANQFNDKLLAINNDELFQVVNMRVVRELRTALLAYRNLNGYYPRANLYSDATYNCNNAAFTGRLPVNVASCSQQFLLIPAPFQAWGATMPAWFAPNLWNIVTHYSVSQTCTSTVQFSLFPLTLLNPIVAGVIESFCNAGDPITGAVKDALEALGLLTGDLMTVNINGTNRQASVVLFVSGRATTGQPPVCTAVNPCRLEDPNTITGPGYTKPSRFPASNDRMAVVCSPNAACNPVP